MMNHNAEFLNYIFQNSEMGVGTLTKIIDVVEDEELLKHLRAQLKEYRNINEEATKKLIASGHQEKDIGAMQKISAYMSISMKTMVDKTPSHIAEMLMQGSTMGIIDAIRNIKKYSEAEEDIVKLAKRLLKMEENNLEQLKNFL